jgi:hypothetical protein
MLTYFMVLEVFFCLFQISHSVCYRGQHNLPLQQADAKLEVFFITHTNTVKQYWPQPHPLLDLDPFTVSAEH